MDEDRERAQEDADALRDAADVLTRRLQDPHRSPPALTGVAMLAEGLRMEADRIEADYARMHTAEQETRS